MKTRDEFAIAAMPLALSMLRDEHNNNNKEGTTWRWEAKDADRIAKYAYILADAMRREAAIPVQYWPKPRA